ncbi:hypothetical protein HQ447_08250 [bacterium]|nr:hypothetical protein [bacterium]
MLAASPFLAIQEPDPHLKTVDVWEFADICLDQTAEALHQTRAGTPAEISRAVSAVRQDHAREIPSDLIEGLARILGHGEEHISSAILDLGNRVAATLSLSAPLIPFGGKLIAPSAFYDSFDRIHKIARVLLSPVIYAEDTDAIGTASVNPIASMILAEEIRNQVFKRFGIRPFVTIARLEYESWAFLTRKHFEL